MKQNFNETLRQFTDDVKQIYGDGVLSVILYGSGASHEYVEGTSNVNCLVILRSVTLEELRKCTNHLRRWYKAGIGTPLFLDPAYIRSSTDVFPIEFLDMKERYRVLHGQDFLHDLVLDNEHLRFQCEQELKGKMLRLRQLYVEDYSSEKELGAMLSKSISSFMVLFRALLRLKGMPAPHSAEEIFGEIAQLGLPTDTMKRIYRLRHEKKRLKRDELNSLFGQYLAEIEAAVDSVDKLTDSSVTS